MTSTAMNEEQIETLRITRAAPGRTLHQSMALHLRGTIDEVALVAALEMLIAEQQCLRQTVQIDVACDGPHFEPGSGHGSGYGSASAVESAPGDNPFPRLVVHPSMTLPLECRDLSWLNAADKAEESKSILGHEASAPFDLNGSPLFRTLLIRFSVHHHVLVFTAHPLIASVAAVREMMTRLTELYVAATCPRSLPAGNSMVGPGPLQTSPTATKSAGHATGATPSLDRARPVQPGRGVSSPAGVSPAAPLLPADFSRGPKPVYAVGTNSIPVPAELLAMMRRRQYGKPRGGVEARDSSAGTLLELAPFAAFAHWLHGTTMEVALAGEIVCGLLVDGAGPASADALLAVRSLQRAEDTVASFLSRLRESVEAGLGAGVQTGQNNARTGGNALAADWARNQFYFQSSEVSKSFVSSESSESAGSLETRSESVDPMLAAWSDLGVELVWNARSTAPADVAFCFRVHAQDAFLDCSYNARLFKAETIARWSAEIMCLLRAMLEHPQVRLSDIVWLSSAERYHLLIDLNRTAIPYPRESSIQDVFERQVLRTPDTVALINEEGSLTYAELNEKANQLARSLRRYGIRRGDRIALAVERSLAAVVGAVATLKAGCAYIPIDAAEPGVDEVMKHARPSAVLTQARFASLFATQGTHVILLDEDWAAVATEPLENLALPIGAEAPACVLYRRDAAGELRGILLPHRSLVRLMQESNGSGGSSLLNFGRGEVVLQLARLTDAAWALEVWGPLLNGGQLAMLPPGWQAPVQIGSAIEHYGATALCLNGSDLDRIVDGHIEAMSPLRQIVTDTVTLAPALLSRLLQQCPQMKLVSGFGPAENGTFACMDAVSLHSIEASAVARTMGRPAANTRVYILDNHCEVVRPGETGELHVAGDGLAIGYLHAPELTDEKFFMHSFSPLLRERLFRTGCLACYRKDGRIQLLGTVGMGLRVDSPDPVKKAFAAPAGAESDLLEAGKPEAGLEDLEAVGSFVGD